MSLIVGGALAAPACAEQEPLEAYSWLVGVWAAQGSSPEAGEYTEELAYEWTMGRKFMKSTYVMRAGEKIVWTDVGMVGIDPATGHLVGFNFGMDGTIGWGRTTEHESGESFLTEGSVVGPNPKQDYRARMRRLEGDRLEFTIEMKQGDAYVTQSTQTYSRKPTPTMTPCPEPDEVSTPEPLKALAPLVGTWSGSGTAAGDREVSIETTFEWRLNRTFLRRQQVVKDADGAAIETVEWIGWDPERKEIAAFVFDADGSAARALARMEDGALLVEFSGGATTRTRHRLDGEGRLDLLIEAGRTESLDVALKASLERK